MSRTGRWSTQATVGSILLVVGVVAAVLLALSLPAGAPLHPEGSSVSTSLAPSSSLGEQIFQTGTDGNGRLIPRSGVSGMRGSVVACANCHGSDARGRTIQMMMGQIEVPDIRWSTLTAPPTEPGDVAFDPDSFFRAVTQGIDPPGEQLKVFMPRWELTRADSDTLIEYLKTL
jgi:mono/diheme cytochrome c family protein